LQRIITVALPHTQSPKRVVTKAVSEEEKDASGRMIAGKTYPFQLALTNPLYDPIQVRLSVQRVHVSAATDAGEKSRGPPFAVSLPTAPFSIATFAEAWEYDDDEDMFGLDDDDLLLGRKSGQDTGKKGKSKTVGVLEKRANVITVVGGEVVIGKEARGNVKVSLRNASFSRVWELTLISSICWYHTRTGRMTQRHPRALKGPQPRLLARHRRSRHSRSIP
jgi:dynactin-4